MAAPLIDLTGEVIDRRFRVEQELGSGGMGTVWRVQHVESLQRYALKVLNPGLYQDQAVVQRFLREARAIAALRTRHVVRIVDAQMGYVHHGMPLPFLVMELLEGGTLDVTIERRGRLEAAQAVWALGQVTRALKCAHDQGIVHRDLKPTNVLVASDEDGAPIVKLCDFGIAKLLPGPLRSAWSEASKSTQAEQLLGSPLYMAPEQLRDARRVVAATDQWAFGLLAYYCLTGSDYFGRSADLPDLVIKIARDPLAAPSSLNPGLSRAFDGWFLRSCHRDPTARFGSITEQMAALEAALGHPTPVPIDIAASVGPSRTASPPTPWSAARSVATLPRRARRYVALLALSAVLSVAALVVWRLVLLPRLGSSLEPKAAAASTASEPRPPPAPPASAPAPARAVAAAEGPAIVPAVASAGTPTETGAPGRPHRTVRRPKATAPRPSAAPKPPATAPTAERLRSGAVCSRSAQCESGLCVAEVCR